MFAIVTMGNFKPDVKVLRYFRNLSRKEAKFAAVLITSIYPSVLQVSLSFSIVAAVRVGNFIGSGDPERAKISAKVCLKLASKSLHFPLVFQNITEFFGAGQMN